MKIISKFHDYYDSVISYGADERVIYKRKTKEIDAFEIEEDLQIPEIAYGCFTSMFIGFCGEIIPVLKFNFEKEIPYLNEKKTIETFCYNYEDAERYYKEHYKESFKTKITIDYRKRIYNGKKQIKDFFNFRLTKFNHIFREHNTPVFLLDIKSYTKYFDPSHKIKITVNPNLIEYAFFKCKDPFTAFQDISQYISGVLGIGEPNTLDISDKHMRDKKGFDELSFKTRKGTKKPRRKRNNK